MQLCVPLITEYVSLSAVWDVSHAHGGLYVTSHHHFMLGSVLPLACSQVGGCTPCPANVLRVGLLPNLLPAGMLD